MKGRIPDYIINTYLSVLARFRYWGLNYKPIRKDRQLVDYDLIVEDKFENMDNWNPGHWWGRFHPTGFSYVDNDVNLHQHNDGILMESRLSKHIENNVEYTISHAAIEHKQMFSHGFFELTAFVKKSRNVWHAPLWFVSRGGEEPEAFPVLPEIDVSEVYSNGSAKRFLSQSTIHYGESYQKNEAKKTNSMNHLIRSLGREDSKFAMLWTADGIEIYHDDHFVRRITRKDVISKLKYDLMPIIGSGSKKEKTDDVVGQMKVKLFKYYSKKR